MIKKTLVGLSVALLAAVSCDAPVPTVSPSRSELGIFGGRVPTSVAYRPVGGVSADIVVDPGDPNTLTYTFNDLAVNCALDAQTPNPYEGLHFLTTPYLAPCDSPNGTVALIPSSSEFFDLGATFEVLIQLPDKASAVSIESWAFDVPGSFPRTLIAYDAAGTVLATAVDNTLEEWATLTVAAARIDKIGLRMGQATNYLDNLRVTYKRDPKSKDECKNGVWTDFGFKNQGQCIRFVETGKDSRLR